MRHGMEWRRFGRFIGVGVGIAVFTVLAVAVAKDKINSARQAELADGFKSEMVVDLEGLAKLLAEGQAQFMQILPPEPAFRLRQPFGMFAFDPAGFPKDFLNGLVYDVERGCPVYTVTVRENPLTGEILFYNGDDKPVSSLPPVRDYDAWWLFEHFHPELYYTGRVVDEPLAELMALFNPVRLSVELKLIPADYVETYASDVVAAWTAAEAVESVSRLAAKGGMAKSMRLPAAATGIVSRVDKVTDGMRVTMQYPDDCTNRLEVFICSNLCGSWSLIVTNLSTLGTNEIIWIDTTATNAALRFYSACDADTDSDMDGLVDERERLMYKTCSTNIDTDGDGLIDGYSGLVSTNNYPGGVATNGGIYVEGEMTWATAPLVSDTDADGMGDGWEVANGHNPTNANDPPNVSGTIFYTGRQTGTVHVVAVTSSSSWSTNASCTLAVSNVYLIPHLEQTNYWLKAWMDTEVDGLTNATEAQGVYTNASIIITNRATGKDIILADPDNDSDGVPDWWEEVHFGSVTNPATDPDGDNYNNQEEYDAGTDPTNTLSHPWNISGTITYTGPQTGTVWVAACTDGATWNWARVATNAQPGAYTITHLPPNTNYWVRAWRDSNGDGQPPSTTEGYTAWEAWGTHSGNPVMLDTNVAGVDVTLADPDNDADGLSDWWEVRYGLDPTAGGAGAAVAWWKFDETTGTNAADSVGTNHGILNGFAVTGWTNGVVSNALVFNGSNSYVSVSDSVDLKPVTIGLGLWIKPSVTYTNGRSATFLSKEVGSKGYSIGYENGGLVFRFQSSGAREVVWPCALTAGVPVHVVGMYGGSWQQLYVDAQLKAETNYNWETGFGNISQGTNALRMGAAVAGAASNCFEGLLDDVRITGDDWSSNQVHAVWELGADPDGDGMGNAEEYKYGTSPTNSDGDADGLLDNWEIQRFGNLQQMACGDPDMDGMSNLEEFWNGTNPSDGDTDHDGLSDSFELRIGNTVVFWGDSYGGSHVPSNLSFPVVIAAGGYHNMVLQADRTVVCWGENYDGQTDVPTGLTNAVAIAAGEYHSMGLQADGTVFCWGYNNHGQANTPAGLTNVVAITAGRFHSMALQEDGAVVCWGNVLSGQTNVLASLSNVVAIAAGSAHSLVLQADGAIVCWGQNWSGETNVPANLTNVMAIAAGGYHSMALQADGTVVCWGENYYGQTDVPTGLTNVIAITAGAYHSMALQADGTVVCWGYDGYGVTNVPAGVTNVVAITAGGDHSMALMQLSALDPNNPDTDQDGMSDGWEIANGLNPFFNDASLDADNDGLINAQEFIAGSKANDPDSDDDGLPDAVDSDPMIYDTLLPAFTITYPTDGMVCQ